jgi:hypothetical protein
MLMQRMGTSNDIPYAVRLLRSGNFAGQSITDVLSGRLDPTRGARIIAAIMDGSAPADLTVTSLAQRLAYLWEEQEPRI